MSSSARSASSSLSPSLSSALETSRPRPREVHDADSSPPPLSLLALVPRSVKLDGCVISNGVQVRDRAQLKDCEIGRDVIVDFDSASLLYSLFLSRRGAARAVADGALRLCHVRAAQTKGEQLVVEVD